MSEFLGNLILGCQVVFTPANMLYCFIGVFIGTLIGVLPGIGPVGAMSILLPVTYGMKPVSSIILLAGIYYGAMYGGSTTSILVNIPGEAATVVTCLDGYQMARQGRAGPALGMAAFCSFIAGTVGIVLLMLLAEPLATVAIKFGPPEFFSLILFALSLLIYLARGSMIKAAVVATLGFALSQVGIDVLTARSRFTFGIMELYQGVGLVPVVMGLFGIAEVFGNLEKSQNLDIFKTKIKGLLPNWQDWKDSFLPIFRGTLMGFFLGILPGGGAVVASFVSYTVEKRFSKHPEKFGTGVIEGVAGPESANNSATSGAFVPLFSLGIPSTPVTALLLGAMMIHGLQPGPLLIKEQPEIFWGTIMSMYVGNVMLLVLNLPLIGLWVKLLKVPYHILFPFILFFCVIGSYTINNSIFDVMVMLVFGVVGFLFQKFKYEPAPLVMAFILGDLLETSFRQSLLISEGSLLVFFKRPISLSCLILALCLFLSPIIFKKRREIMDKIG